MENVDEWTEATLRLIEVERHLGNRVRELRKERGWSQAELVTRLEALGVGMHQTTVAKLERGNRPTPAEELWALATVFGVDYSDLLPAPPNSDPDAELMAEYAAAATAVDMHNRRLMELEAQRAVQEEQLAHAQQRMRELAARAQKVRDDRLRAHGEEV